MSAGFVESMNSFSAKTKVMSCFWSSSLLHRLVCTPKIAKAPVIAASRHLSSHHQSPEDIPELQERKEKQYFAQQYLIPEKGKVYAKRPFKFLCKEGKYYVWCSCGYSKTQPFCDGTHKNQHLRIQLRPVVFVPKETREYWFCNCKQTKNRPFCDGTHNCEEVQQAPSTIRY